MKAYSRSNACSQEQSTTELWEGYSDLVWTGCAARASKPIPILKGHFEWKEYSFLGIFLEM